MRHWRIAMTGVTLALLGTAIPLAVTAYLSWRMAITAQEERLEQTAALGVARVEGVYEDAASTLRSAAATDFQRCSPGHIGRMRHLAILSLAVENISFIPDGVLECDALNIAQRRMSQPDGGTLLPDGISMTANETPRRNDYRPMMVLRFGDYEAVIDQLRFFPTPEMQPAAIEVSAPDGSRLVTRQNGAILVADPALPDEPQARGERTGGGWTVIARQPRLTFREHMRNVELAFLTAGLLLVGFFTCFAIWLMRRRLSPRSELALAIANREFIAYYQPIIALDSRCCVGAEALVRWRRPDGTLVRPDLFIPFAEDTGLIQPITDQVIEAVIADLGDLLRADRHLHISINLGAADISSGRILPVLERALRGTGIEPQQIWLEATERGFVDIDGASRTLAELRRRGHMSAIDDFGTGYSGLKYLQRLPVDALKIDKSFIDAVGTEAPTRHVTEHIIQMACELKLRIVAEGVETEAQAAYLRRRGVDFAQGWLFSRALPAAEFTAFCNDNRKAYGMPGNVVTLAAE